MSLCGFPTHEAHNRDRIASIEWTSLVLTLVLAESSIELVPKEIARERTVLSWAKRKAKEPQNLILDQSYHHYAILRLGRNAVGRGRPDIAHFSLLTALGSPLNMENKLRCFIHTRDDIVINVNPRARLPRNTDRFTSLLELLYQDSVVPAKGTPLMSLKHQTLPDLLKETSSGEIVALTRMGVQKRMESVASELADARSPVVLVGGFPFGHFSRKTSSASSQQYSIDTRPLEAWTVVGRAVYDFEKAIGLERFPNQTSP